VVKVGVGEQDVGDDVAAFAGQGGNATAVPRGVDNGRFHRLGAGGQVAVGLQGAKGKLEDFNHSVLLSTDYADFTDSAD
jgi:hypothetical protein